MQGADFIELWCEKCQNSFWVNKSTDVNSFFCPLCKARTELKDCKSERVPYGEIKELWNNICISFPKVVSITNKRKKSLRCRWEQLKELQKFEDAFQKLEASDFCKGKMIEAGLLLLTGLLRMKQILSKFWKVNMPIM